MRLTFYENGSLKRLCSVLVLVGRCFSRHGPWYSGEGSVGQDRGRRGRFNELHAEHIGKFDVTLLSMTDRGIIAVCDMLESMLVCRWKIDICLRNFVEHQSWACDEVAWFCCVSDMDLSNPCYSFYKWC